VDRGLRELERRARATGAPDDRRAWAEARLRVAAPCAACAGKGKLDGRPGGIGVNALFERVRRVMERKAATVGHPIPRRALWTTHDDDEHVSVIVRATWGERRRYGIEYAVSAHELHDAARPGEFTRECRRCAGAGSEVRAKLELASFCGDPAAIAVVGPILLSTPRHSRFVDTRDVFFMHLGRWRALLPAGLGPAVSRRGEPVAEVAEAKARLIAWAVEDAPLGAIP